MLHVAAFIFMLLLLLTVYIFRGVIVQAWKGTTKSVDRLETEMKKENEDEQV